MEKVKKKIVVYSDESMHIRNDGYDFMVLSSIYMRESTKNKLNKEINTYLKNSKLSGELKWTKISNGNLIHYKNVLNIISTYNKNNQLNVRNLLALNKTKFTKDSDEYYNIMFFYLFKYIITVLENEKHFHLFIDYKDNQSGKTADKLALYLNNTFYNKINIKCTPENSKDHRMIQVADIIAGAMSYKKRDLKTSKAKIAIIDHIEKIFDVTLNQSSPFSNSSFNTFIWSGNSKA